MFRGFLLVAVLTVALCSAQQRFPSGEFKGFLKSPTEHIVVRIADPLSVTRIWGLVQTDGTKEPISDVYFEIRGPGSLPTVRSFKTDKRGDFAGRAPDGTYMFKATKEGFQSIVGTIVLKKKSGAKRVIFLNMQPGI